MGQIGGPGGITAAATAGQRQSQRQRRGAATHRLAAYSSARFKITNSTRRFFDQQASSWVLQTGLVSP